MCRSSNMNTNSSMKKEELPSEYLSSSLAQQNQVNVTILLNKLLNFINF